MMRFGREERESMESFRRKPPPNYFARGVQLKILALLFLFMGVLALMSHARDPKTWEWMWKLQGQHSQEAGKGSSVGSSSNSTGTKTPAGGQGPSEIDTRGPRPRYSESLVSGPLVTNGARTAAVAGREAQPPDVDVETAQLDGWDHVLRQLAHSERTLLRQGLWLHRHHQELSDEERAEWQELMKRLRQCWDDYHTRALVFVAGDDGQLTDAQKRSGMEIIEASKSIWEQRSAALAAVGESRPLTEEQSAVLSALEQQFEQRAFSRIEDNTVLRSAEREAWDRCWDKLQALSPEAMAQAEGPLTFVQLFSQPEEYRGRLVKITGTARWGYRVDSREKRFGPDGYVVLGILPGRGVSSPMVVYCIDLPPGFPQIRGADSSERGSPLDEDVEVTGFFFKRWLHSSAGGMNLSPLILGRITHWTPRPTPLANAQSVRVGPATFTAAVLAMALLGIGIAAWVYRSSHWSRPAVSSMSTPSEVLPSFDQTQVQGSTVDTLRELAQADDEQRG